MTVTEKKNIIKIYRNTNLLIIIEYDEASNASFRQQGGASDHTSSVCSSQNKFPHPETISPTRRYPDEVYPAKVSAAANAVPAEAE